MTLTEQWKKGKLPDGNYWVMLDVYEDDNPELSTVQMSENKPIGWFEESVKEVLAKVPSYEEFKRLEHENTLLKVANAELRDKLDTVASMVKQGFGDDNCSFYDLLRKIERLV